MKTANRKIAKLEVDGEVFKFSATVAMIMRFEKLTGKSLVVALEGLSGDNAEFGIIAQLLWCALLKDKTKPRPDFEDFTEAMPFSNAIIETLNEIMSDIKDLAKND